MSFISFVERVKGLDNSRKKRAVRKKRYSKKIYSTVKQEEQAYKFIKELISNYAKECIEIATKGYRTLDDLNELENYEGVNSSFLASFSLDTDKLIQSVERSIANSFAEFSKISIGERYIPKSVSSEIKKIWKDNFLIQCTSATNELKKIISKDVYDSVMRGDSLSVVKKKILESTDDYSKKKAQFIARDQVSKLNGSINKAQQKDAEIDLYVWSAVNDARTRDTHSNLSGLICSWDDPNIYFERVGNSLEKRKRKSNMFIGNPSDDYQCRCFGLPFIPELEGIEQNE